MNIWHDFKVGDKVIVNLRLVPLTELRHFDGKTECEATIERLEDDRCYLVGTEWTNSGKATQVYWIIDPQAIRHVVDVTNEIIESSTQDLASWIKEFTDV